MFIIAKFNSQCAETGKPIKKGDSIFWSKGSKKVYCKDSEKYKGEVDAKNTSSYIQAQENAYFDRFNSYNNY